MVRFGKHDVVERKHAAADQNRGDEHRSDCPIQADASGFHGRQLVVLRHLAEGQQRRHQDGHWYRECKCVTEAQEEYFGDRPRGHALRQEVVQEVLQDLGEQHAGRNEEPEGERAQMRLEDVSIEGFHGAKSLPLQGLRVPGGAPNGTTGPAEPQDVCTW